jgi:hypothetical protein
MTVIAFKDGVMAADTQLSYGNSASRAQKIVRLPDGGVAGGCGLWCAAYAVLKFLADGGTEDDDPKTLPNPADCQVLIARPDGSLWVIEERFPAYPLLDKVAAIGCGADAAHMAMTLGLSPVEAVGKVINQDILCGGNVQSMEVEPTHEYSGAKTHRKRK